MIDHPVFPFPDPKVYVETMSRKSIPLVGNLLAGGAPRLARAERTENLEGDHRRERGEPARDQVLERHAVLARPPRVWEGTQRVLRGAAPSQLQCAVPRRRSPDDSLTQALNAALQSTEALFDFKLQLQTDPVAMPVEDISVEWNEAACMPVTVATLSIPPQHVDPSGELAARCESMSFNPWHCLAEHRPIGGMNRLRKLVHLASVQKRDGGPASVSGASV